MRIHPRALLSNGVDFVKMLFETAFDFQVCTFRISPLGYVIKFVDNLRKTNTNHKHCDMFEMETHKISVDVVGSEIIFG